MDRNVFKDCTLRNATCSLRTGGRGGKRSVAGSEVKGHEATTMWLPGESLSLDPLWKVVKGIAGEEWDSGPCTRAGIVGQL